MAALFGSLSNTATDGGPGLDVPDLATHAAQLRLTAGVSTARRPVQKMGLGVARRAQDDSRSSAVIAEQMRTHTLQNFRRFCAAINVDPLNQAAVQLAVILMSRQFRSLEEGSGGGETLAHFGDEAHKVDWAGVARMRQLCSVATIHDWSSLLHYLELAESTASFKTPAEQSLAALTAALQHAGLEFACTVPGLRERCLMHLSMQPTPQEKMLERLFVQHARAHEMAPPHDLEMRSLRVVTHYNNNAPPQSTQQADLVSLLCAMVPTKAFVQDMSAVLARMEEEQLVQIDERSSRHKNARMQLRYLVQAEANKAGATAYDRTFASWANQQRFPIATSLRLQQVLYFLRAQTKEVSPEVYALYFAPALVQRVCRSTIDAIDPDAMHAVLAGIRSYRHNVADLIDFRVSCLAGVSVTLRSALTLQQVLQLYIAAFQHPSVRETLWRRVLNVWNHSVQQALLEFTAEREFDVVNVLHTVMHGISGGKGEAA